MVRNPEDMFSHDVARDNLLILLCQYLWCHDIVGYMTATVKYQGYDDEEEVDVARLQKVKVTEREGVGEFK